mgnify:CR=1 FL=1
MRLKGNSNRQYNRFSSASKRTPESDTSLANVGTAAYVLPDELLARLCLITREDYRAIRHSLDRQHELEPSVVERLAHRLAEPFAERLGAQRRISD